MIKVSLLKIVLALFLTPFVSFAGTASQTDWTGGEGVLGPVTNWDNLFYASVQIDFSVSSNIEIIETMLNPLEFSVDEEFGGAFSVNAADVDGDGDIDILGAAQNSDDITWWENSNGIGSAWIEHSIADNYDGPYSVYSSDLDGDGDIDVLGASQYEDAITWWENIDASGTDWVEHTIDGNFDQAHSVYSADLNLDGYIDVLGAAGADNEIAWWENIDGSASNWVKHIVSDSFGCPFSVCTADVNGDGHIDVLGAAYNDCEISWWENTNGSGTNWIEHTIDGEFVRAASVYSADIDGDGDMDVLGAADEDDDITWWENTNGSGTNWIEHTIDGDFDGAKSVYAADIDGDGDTDVLGAAQVAGWMWWWENIDGSGTNWTEHMIDLNFDGAHAVYCADIDGDDNLDVLGAAYHLDDISWWNLTRYANAGTLTSSIFDANMGDSDSWTYFDWDATEPSNTNVKFLVRASDDWNSMGSWTTLTAPSDLSAILNNGDRYFQYQAYLTTSDFYITPTLHDMSVSWTEYTSAEGESEAEVVSMILHGATPNPAVASATLSFYVPIDSRVNLSVFDIVGRTVFSVNDIYPSGTNEIVLGKLSTGVYLVRMTSADFTATTNFVIVE